MDPEQASRKKQKLAPSLRKITLMLVLLLVPIMLAGPAFLLLSMSRARDTAEEQIVTAVENQLFELDATLSTVNVYLMDTLLNNTLCQTIAQEQDLHLRNVAARDLQTEIGRQSHFWTEDLNFFYYSPSTDTPVAQFGGAAVYDDCRELSRRVTEAMRSGEAVNARKWTPAEVNGSVYLLRMYLLDGRGMACWIPCRSALSLLEESILSRKGFYAILDGSGQPVLSNGRAERWLDADRQPIHRLGSFSRVFEPSQLDLRLLVVDEEYLNLRSSLLLLLFFAVILTIVLAFSLYTLFYFRRYIQQPFEQFQQHVSDYAASQETQRKRGFSELNEAVDAFDSLKEQLEQLKIDVYEERLALARTELEYFQLQIKPHFFVNCFSILFGMAQKQDYSKIQNFCLKLSNYVRYLFRDGLTTVPLQDELSMVREYLDIQNIRHRTDSSMKDRVDPELFSARIPPLLLLSFVENSVKHAPSDGTDLSVQISVERRELDGSPALALAVQDNGPGYPTEVINELNSLSPASDPSPSRDGRHIGVRNICKRLTLLYGSRFAMSFSNPDGHARVEVVLPETHAQG